MKHRALLLGLTAFTAMTATSVASAEIRPGFYIGAGAGTVDMDDDVLVDDGDTGFKVFAGYALNDIVAVEVSYIDGGTAEDSLSGGPGFNIQAEVDTSIINLSVLGDLVLTEQFSVFGRVGYAFIDRDTDGSFQLGGPLMSFSQSDNDDRVSYGVGAVYRFTEQFEARAEFEGFDVKQGDLMAITASLLFRF